MSLAEFTVAGIDNCWTVIAAEAGSIGARMAVKIEPNSPRTRILESLIFARCENAVIGEEYFRLHLTGVIRHIQA
jgi:hypothetical protein